MRYFVSRGFELFAAQSYAKNFGLYCERVGNLAFVQKDAATSAAVLSQLTLIVRAMYSNPPAFGGRIVDTILNDPTLRNGWYECIKIMSNRILKMRKALYDELVRLGTPGTWNHIIDQIGMFSYTGLNGKYGIQWNEEKKTLSPIDLNGIISSALMNRALFVFSLFAEKQVQLLIDEYHIYLLKTGRISMSGLNENNVSHVAKAIHDAVTSIPN